MLIACATHSWAPPLTASWAAKRARGDQPIVCQQVADDKGKAAVGAAVAAAALTAASVSGVNGIFGVLDNTADELADILGVEDVPPVVASAVRALSPLYTPLKAVSPSCTDALFPEFNEMLDMNDCLLLPSRVFWSKTGAQPITIQQTMTTSEMWQVSTGSTVWGGGVVLQRYLESLGTDWQGKSVIELGTGTGLGGVTAARLGASEVLVTDRDAAVLELAEANARANLPARVAGAFRTGLLEWGPAPKDSSVPVEPAYTRPWDVVIGADLTYNRDAWPVLVDTLQRLQAPAILSASERRTDELKSLSAYLTERGLSFELVSSPMEDGYAANKIKIFRIARPPKPAAPAAPAPVGPAAPADRVVSAAVGRAAMLAEARREAAEQAAGAGAAAALPPQAARAPRSWRAICCAPRSTRRRAALVRRRRVAQAAAHRLGVSRRALGRLRPKGTPAPPASLLCAADGTESAVSAPKSQRRPPAAASDLVVSNEFAVQHRATPTRPSGLAHVSLRFSLYSTTL